MIRDTCWVALFPVVVPLVLLRPPFIVGRVASGLGLTLNTQFALNMLWLLPTALVSFRGAWKYHYSRRDRAQPNV